MDMLNVKINGISVSVEKGSTILDAARAAGVEIPTLCFMKEKNEIGACRICVVEANGGRGFRIVTACVYPVSEGMEVLTNTEKIQKARRTTLELILSTHEKKCLSCVRSTNCELQKLCRDYGVEESAFEGFKPTYELDTSTPHLVRDNNKCVLCRRCVAACNEQYVGVIGANNRGIDTAIGTPFEVGLSNVPCISCGQCTVVCPTGALVEKDDTDKIWAALADPDKHVVVQTAPSIRATLGECFGMPIGTNVEGKMVAALRRLGFDKIFDTDFAADLTIVEEANELVERIKNNGTLPMITSCSPGWVKFCEYYYPDMLEHLSTCKSPQQMAGAVIKTYYADKMGIDPKDITSGDLGKIFKVNMTQAEFYADLCEAITTCLVSSRQDYADNLQDYLIALLGDIFGAADRDTSGVAESFAKKVQDNAKKLFYSLTIPGMLKNGTAVKLLTGYLVEALKENGIVTYDLDGIRDAFATLVPRLSKMALKYPGTTMTLLANLLVIMSAHFGESCLAWMRCLSDTYMTNKQRVSYAGLFDDVAASAWYAPSVDYVKYGRLMYGTGNNLFQPDAQMTRAMFVQVLYALEGSPSVSGLSCPLTDAGGSWYTDAVIWAYNAGVAAGVSATEFAPNEPLTREQMVTMLYGYASRSEQLTGDAGALSPYRDQANVSAWAREAMVWAVSTGIVCGTSPTTLSPQKIGTRAEVATVVMGFCEQ